MTGELIQVNLQGLPEFEKAMREIGDAYPKETRQSLNRTAMRSATRVRREMAAQTGLAVRDFKRRVSAYRMDAKGRRKHASVWAGIERAIPLNKIQGASTSLGGILKTNKRKTQTFRARMPNGRVKSMVRAPNASHKEGERRKGRKLRGDDRTMLPIEEPKLRLDSVMTAMIIRNITSEQLADWFPDELRRRVRVTNRRLAKKYITRAARSIR